MEEKSYGLNPDEEIEEFILGELMEAASSKDVSAFRAALEALIFQCIDFEMDAEALNEG